MVNNSYDAMFDAAGQHYNVDPQLLKTIFHMESGGNPNARRGASGEIGPMQFMPQTANGLHLQDPTDMTQAVPAVAQIIRQGLDANRGDVAAALRTYNGGAGGVNNPQTIPYVLKAQTLYPQMRLTTGQQPPTPATKDDNYDVGDAILSGKSSAPIADDPSVAAGDAILSGTPTKSAPIADDPSVAAGDAILSATPTAKSADASAAPAIDRQPAQMPAGASPTLDMISPDLRHDSFTMSLRNAFQPGPNDYQMQGLGRFLPIAHDEATGENRLAVPQAFAQLGNGVLDLMEGPRTGTVTPDAQATLGTAALMGKLTPSIGPIAHMAVPVPPVATAAKKLSPAAEAVIRQVSDGVVTALSRGVGYHFGDFGGYLAGEAVAPILNDIKNRYGPAIAAKAGVWIAAGAKTAAKTATANQTTDTITGNLMQNQD